MSDLVPWPPARGRLRGHFVRVACLNGVFSAALLGTLLLPFCGYFALAAPAQRGLLAGAVSGAWALATLGLGLGFAVANLLWLRLMAPRGPARVSLAPGERLRFVCPVALEPRADRSLLRWLGLTDRRLVLVTQHLPAGIEQEQLALLEEVEGVETGPPFPDHHPLLRAAHQAMHSYCRPMGVLLHRRDGVTRSLVAECLFAQSLIEALEQAGLRVAQASPSPSRDASP